MKESQASKIFQLVVDTHAKRPPDLMMLSFTNEEKLNYALSVPIQKESYSDILSRTVALRRRIEGHCMDLLICPQESSLVRLHQDGGQDFNHWGLFGVEYLHPTVKGFLISPKSLDMLLSYTNGPLNCSRYKCNAMLVQMVFVRTLIEAASHSRLTDRDYQCGIQVALFSTFIRNLPSLDSASDPANRLMFETAVGQCPVVPG